MKLSTTLLTLALIAVPVASSTPALAAGATSTKSTVTTVARYSFDQGVSSRGTIVENTGRGTPLTVRAAAGGKVSAIATKTGRYIGFPAPCATDADPAACPRAILEGTDDADLDPGTHQFRYGATILIGRSQLKNSSNVMQKGVVSTDSQWKLQIGASVGKAQCVVVGLGSTKPYIARSAGTVADSRWHKVMCIRTPTGLYVFVDGKRSGQVSVPASVSISNRMPLRIGGPNLAIASDTFNGFLDEVYVAQG